jgi:hypothetical protein
MKETQIAPRRDHMLPDICAADVEPASIQYIVLALAMSYGAPSVSYNMVC